MIRRLILTLIVGLTFSSSFGREGLLDIVISIEIKSTPVKTILELIEEKAEVSFTYNQDIIDDTRIVSLNIKNKTIREGLELIFDDDVRFKEVGSHIVLLKNEDKEEIKARKKENLEYIFIGTITDKRTGKPISGASIYEVDDRQAAISDERGFYSMTIPARREVISLYFKKKGYKEEVIVIEGDPSQDLMYNVELEPLVEEVSTIPTKQIQKLDSEIPEKAISGELVSSETYIHGENLEDIEEIRWAQISLVPSVSIGSNLSTNALVYNHFSFNVLGGFSKGVKGCEIGGLFNITKEHMYGAQIGGLANLTGGDLIGVQVGGISNILMGYGTGVQLAGVSTITKRDFTGAQISGVSTIIRGGFTGLQLSGVSSITWEKSVGAQVSGVCNIVRDSLIGGQVSGVANISRGGINFVQISGVGNIADKNWGLQVTGITNFAKENNGLQIGLFNSSIRGKGVAIGLFNFVKEGYHKTEISANEIFPVNLVFKTGTQRLYNTYNFGVKFGSQPAYAFGLGFGTYFNFSEKLSMSFDLSGQMVFENDFEAFEFAQLYKTSLTLDIKLAKWITFFAGPSFNVNVMSFHNELGNYTSNISFNPILEDSFVGGAYKAWVGGRIGFRF